jgi:hypothetical protein
MIYGGQTLSFKLCTFGKITEMSLPFRQQLMVSCSYLDTCCLPEKAGKGAFSLG